MPPNSVHVSTISYFRRSVRSFSRCMRYNEILPRSTGGGAVVGVGGSNKGERKQPAPPAGAAVGAVQGAAAAANRITTYGCRENVQHAAKLNLWIPSTATLGVCIKFPGKD